MKSCTKTLRKIPMAMIGALDFSLCGTVWAVNQLAKRGEKVVKCMMDHNTQHATDACPSGCTCTAPDEE